MTVESQMESKLVKSVIYPDISNLVKKSWYQMCIEEEEEEEEARELAEEKRRMTKEKERIRRELYMKGQYELEEGEILE